MRVAFLTTDDRDSLGGRISPTPRFGAAPAALLEGMASIQELEVHVVSCVRSPMTAPERLAKNIWFHSLQVPRLGWMRSGYQGTIRAVRRCLSRLQPDLVHAQGTERDCAMNAAFSGRPSLVTVHGHMRRIARRLGARPLSFYWLAARLESLALRRAGGVLCLNQYSHQQVVGLNPRTWIVPNAVNPAFFQVQGQPGAQPTLLCVANVSPWKNQVALIRALEPLVSSRPFTLRFIGSADEACTYDREFLSLVSERSWCVYSGRGGADDVIRALEQAALLVLPSLEENCPLAVLEAMASGVPVAASTAGGIPDLIEDGRTGRLFNPCDGASIRDAVCRMLDDPSGMQDIATRARQWAAEAVRPAPVARRHFKVYQELLSRDS